MVSRAGFTKHKLIDFQADPLEKAPPNDNAEEYDEDSEAIDQE